MPKPHSSLKADPLGQLASGLASRLARKRAIDSRAILRALHETLDGADEASRTARLSAQLHLASVADSLMAGRAPARVERLLSTVEAAQIMACSRPYVAMLIDSGKLTGATKTAGGHRKVPLASVEAWISLEQAKAILQMDGRDFDTLKQQAATRGFNPVSFSSRTCWRMQLRMNQRAASPLGRYSGCSI